LLLFYKEVIFNENEIDLKYTTLVVLFCMCLILTNTIGHKLFLFPFIHNPVPSAYLVYPFTFVLCDVVNEVYGNKKASYMVWLSFIMSLIVMCVIRAILLLPGHPYWVVKGNPWGFSSIGEYQNAFNAVFEINVTIVLASMTAYLLGQFLDIFLYKIIRKWTGNRLLWLRTNVSTITSQLIDTVVVSGIILFVGFRMDVGRGIEIMFSSYLTKVVASILTTPVFYALIFFFKRRSKLLVAENSY